MLLNSQTAVNRHSPSKRVWLCLIKCCGAGTRGMKLRSCSWSRRRRLLPLMKAWRVTGDHPLNALCSQLIIA